jgi:hypothetical protein
MTPVDICCGDSVIVATIPESPVDAKTPALAGGRSGIT